jgi:hypothetical protein
MKPSYEELKHPSIQNSSHVTKHPGCPSPFRKPSKEIEKRRSGPKTGNRNFLGDWMADEARCPQPNAKPIALPLVIQPKSFAKSCDLEPVGCSKVCPQCALAH